MILKNIKVLAGDKESTNVKMHNFLQFLLCILLGMNYSLFI